MEIIENRDDWLEAFNTGWVAHLAQHGEFDWSLYNRPKNTISVSGKAIDLSQSKLLFISTGGSYVADEQKPFFDSDDTHPHGDYSIRTYPITIPFEKLSIAHSHYDHTAVNADRQVLLPFQHLADMVEEGIIGSLCDTVVSYAGYQPDATRVVDELLPAIQEVVAVEQPDAAFLVPS